MFYLINFHDITFSLFLIITRFCLFSSRVFVFRTLKSYNLDSKYAVQRRNERTIYDEKKRLERWIFINSCLWIWIWHWIEWSLRVREIAGQMLLETFESFPTKSSALFWNVSLPEMLLASLALAGNHNIPTIQFLHHIESGW